VSKGRILKTNGRIRNKKDNSPPPGGLCSLQMLARCRSVWSTSPHKRAYGSRMNVPKDGAASTRQKITCVQLVHGHSAWHRCGAKPRSGVASMETAHVQSADAAVPCSLASALPTRNRRVALTAGSTCAILPTSSQRVSPSHSAR